MTTAVLPNKTEAHSEVSLQAQLLGVLAEEDQGGKRVRRFEMVAYTGEPIRQWWGRAIVELSTIRMPKGRSPILSGHYKPVGYTDEYRIENGRLMAQGVLIPGGDDADEIIRMAEGGYPWQASISGDDFIAMEVPAGQTVECNGRQFAGPGTVVKNLLLRESSFVTLGADAATSATILARAAGLALKEQSMFGKKGVDLASMTAEELLAARPDLVESIKASAAPEADPDPEPEPEPDVSAPDGAPEVAAIRAASGNDPELALLAIEHGLTVDQVKAMATLGADRRAKQTVTDRQRKLAADAAGAPAAGGAPGDVRATSKTSNGDPSKDWDAFPEIRLAWPDDKGGKGAFLRYAALCKQDGSDYFAESFKS